MNNQTEDDYGMMQQMKLWDRKLYALGDEMLVYIQQRAYSILEYRAQQLTKEMEKND